MKSRHYCAVLGMALAVGVVVFMNSLSSTVAHQGGAVAKRLLDTVKVEDGARMCPLVIDFRPNGRVMQGPPLMATLAERPNIEGVILTRGVFAARRLEVPPIGSEITFVGRKGAYRLKLSGIIDWERPLGRGVMYPTGFVSPETAKIITEEWKPFRGISAAELAEKFKGDAGHNFDRVRTLLLWAAALTALAMMLNSLILSIDSRRHEIAVLRMVGVTRLGIAWRVLGEAMRISSFALVLGTVGAIAALYVFVECDPETYPMGAAVSVRGIASAAVMMPVTAVVAAALALFRALRVKPLEAASVRPSVKRPLGMLIAFAFGFGAFVAVEVWGASLTKPFIPSPEWPDAIVSILPGGVSSFDIEKLQNLEGVKAVHELQPLQVNLLPLEELAGPPGGGMDGMRKQYRNALLLASDWLPNFVFVSGERADADRKLREGGNCVITAMMARSRKLKLGDKLDLDCGRGLTLNLNIVGIVDLNWHMVTSRALVRGLNRMPVNTDGPVFVSFDTLASADARPQEFVHMTHLYVDYDEQSFSRAVSEFGGDRDRAVFEYGRRVEAAIVKALNGAERVDKNGEINGNTVRLHNRDEIADGTLSHGASLVGSMARIPLVFLYVISFGFIAMLVAYAESRRREFAVLRTVGATHLQLVRKLAAVSLKVAAGGIAIGLLAGSLIGWLATAATRAKMANWGLPPTFAVPVPEIVRGVISAVGIVLLIAVPSAWVIVRRTWKR